MRGFGLFCKRMIGTAILLTIVFVAAFALITLGIAATVDRVCGR